jgi:NTP pyrophosphatase (non-canonical NTP hydrolase)
MNGKKTSAIKAELAKSAAQTAVHSAIEAVQAKANELAETTAEELRHIASASLDAGAKVADKLSQKAKDAAERLTDNGPIG